MFVYTDGVIESTNESDDLSADERGTGGYGIFIVKNMDDLKYACKDGKNILTMRKFFSE